MFSNLPNYDTDVGFQENITVDKIKVESIVIKQEIASSVPEMTGDYFFKDKEDNDVW